MMAEASDDKPNGTWFGLDQEGHMRKHEHELSQGDLALVEQSVKGMKSAAGPAALITRHVRPRRQRG